MKKIAELTAALKQKAEASKAKKAQAKTDYAAMKTATQKVDFIAKHLGLTEEE